MSLGGENVRDTLTERERDLLDEAWVWRAIQVLALDRGPISVSLDGRTLAPIIVTAERVYHLPGDQQRLLDDARGRK